MPRRELPARTARPEGATPEVREYQVDLVSVIPGNPYQYAIEYYVEAEMKQTSWLMGYDETTLPGAPSPGSITESLARAVADESHREDELWGRFTGYWGPYQFIEGVELFWKPVPE